MHGVPLLTPRTPVDIIIRAWASRTHCSMRTAAPQSPALHWGGSAGHRQLVQWPRWPQSSLPLHFRAPNSCVQCGSSASRPLCCCGASQVPALAPAVHYSTSPTFHIQSKQFKKFTGNVWSALIGDDAIVLPHVDEASQSACKITVAIGVFTERPRPITDALLLKASRT